MPESIPKSEIRTQTEGQVTIKTVMGSPSADAFLQAIQDFYLDNPTPFVIWDIQAGSSKNLTQKDLQRVVSLVKQSIVKRENGRTAIIAPNDLDFGIARSLQTINDIIQLPLQMKIFRTAEEAATWLGINTNLLKKAPS